MSSRLTIVVAIDRQRGIGINNALPWHLPEDLAHFKRTTSGHPIIMGRKTFESIGRPLPNRRNIVITRNRDWHHEGAETVGSLEEALKLLDGAEGYIIGGAQIFTEAMPVTDRLIVTEIDHTFPCDTFFPEIDKSVWQEMARESHHSEQQGYRYDFVTYERRK
jgi:dihydrofolate reductase